MDKDTARNRLAALVAASTTPVIDDDALDLILDAAQVRDETGVLPGDPGYVPTWSLDYAAALAFERKAVLAAATDTGGLESFSEEGASWKRRAGTSSSGFLALARMHKARAAGTRGTFHVIPVNATPATRPRSADYEWGRQ